MLYKIFYMSAKKFYHLTRVHFATFAGFAKSLVFNPGPWDALNQIIALLPQLPRSAAEVC